MSSRSNWRRPRTRVYDANFHAGESYYKSALDGLDRKYGHTAAPPEPTIATNGSSLGSFRASIERERERASTRRSAALEDDDIEIPRRKPANTAALLDEFDSIFEGRAKNGVSKEKSTSRSVKALAKTAIDDDFDQEFEDSMKRIRQSRANRGAAEDMEEIDSNLSSRKKEVRAKLNFTSKVMDSVGLSEDSSAGRKKILSIISSPSDSDELTRWTKIGSGRRQEVEEDNSSGRAAERARKSRVRLEDLESEMAELEQRGAAREKRVRDLRTLLSENESNSKETLQSTVRVKSSISSSTSSSVKTDRKQVAF